MKVSSDADASLVVFQDSFVHSGTVQQVFEWGD